MKRNQKQEDSDTKKFSVPLAVDEIKEKITITTIKQEKLTKEEIIKQAFKFHSQGNIQEATKCYKQLIQQGCNDHVVFANYAVILKNLGKLHEAELSTRKAIELKPEFADAHSIVVWLGNNFLDLVFRIAQKIRKTC